MKRAFEDMSSRPPINQVLKDMLMLKNQEFTFLTTVSFMLLVIYYPIHDPLYVPAWPFYTQLVQPIDGSHASNLVLHNLNHIPGN